MDARQTPEQILIIILDICFLSLISSLQTRNIRIYLRSFMIPWTLVPKLTEFLNEITEAAKYSRKQNKVRRSVENGFLVISLLIIKKKLKNPIKVLAIAGAIATEKGIITIDQ